MAADRYDSSDKRLRVEGQVYPRGARIGQPTWSMFLFALLFVGVGAAIALVGAKVIPVEPSKVHAPFWILTAVGVVFAMGGFMVLGMAVRQKRAEQRRAEAARRYSHEPALADFAWDPNGFAAPRWAKAVRAVYAAVFISLFLSVFNWWAFFNKGPLMLKVFVGLFDILVVAAWWMAVVQLGRAMKFGPSRIVFDRFPYRRSEAAVIRWVVPAGMTSAKAGRFTLRCVEEWYEQVRGPRNRKHLRLVQEQIWAGAWKLEQPRTFTRGEMLELRFELPPDARATELSSERPVFWEFEVKLTLPGFDFCETYLVPVY